MRPDAIRQLAIRESDFLSFYLFDIAAVET